MTPTIALMIANTFKTVATVFRSLLGSIESCLCPPALSLQLLWLPARLPLWLCAPPPAAILSPASDLRSSYRKEPLHPIFCILWKDPKEMQNVRIWSTEYLPSFALLGFFCLPAAINPAASYARRSVRPRCRPAYPEASSCCGRRPRWSSLHSSGAPSRSPRSRRYSPCSPTPSPPR